MRRRDVGRANRGDRAALARRVRAHAHLDRVRSGRRIAIRWRRQAIAIAGASLAAGAAFGDGLATWLTGMPERQVGVIAVRGASHLTPVAVAKAAAVARGAAIGELDPERVATALAGHDWIASARALRLPTGTLVVDVVEREPSAIIAIGASVYAVDREGLPFAELVGSPDPSLPEIVSEGPVSPREADPRLAEAVRLARRLPELGLAAPAQIEVPEEGDAQGYALRLAAPATRVVLGRVDLDARIAAFARLLATRPDAVASSAEIDVRFADQLVLRSAPTRDGSAGTARGRGRGPARSRRPAG